MIWLKDKRDTIPKLKWAADILSCADNHQAAFQSKAKGALHCVTLGCF